MSRPPITPISAARLREVLSYDSETGIFRWLQQRGRCRVGDVAGARAHHGYLTIGIDGNGHCAAHRLAWLYVYGVWPAHQIDHINGIRTDNRIANLRDIASRLNRQNLHGPLSSNTSGFLGVSWNKATRKWVAKMSVDGRNRHLGAFEDPAVAGAAYLAAKRLAHPANTL